MCCHQQKITSLLLIRKWCYYRMLFTNVEKKLMVKFVCKLQLKLHIEQSFKPVLLNHFLWQNIPINTVKSNLQNKQGSIWYLGKFKRICVDFPLTMIQVNLTILMYNKLFLKQEIPIDNQTKPSFHTLL